MGIKKVEISSEKPDIEGAQFKSIYDSQLEELAEIRNPSLGEEELQIVIDGLKDTVKPVYVYYHWRNLVLECVPEAEFIEIKTNRNQYLITKEEQEKLYDMTISIAGMSVGSSILYGLVGSGFGRKFAIADDDVFSTSNLNRVQATVLDVEQSKVETAYRRAVEMNPFLEFELIDGRITDDNIPEFTFNHKTNLTFEEIDDFRMKVVLREEAQKHKIPLVMLTALGDNLMIDIERYDTDESTKPFLGYVSDELLEEAKNSPMTLELMKKLSLALVDRDLLSERAVDSVKDIGTKLVGRPQLYSTVALDSVVGPRIVAGLHNRALSCRESLNIESS